MGGPTTLEGHSTSVPSTSFISHRINQSTFLIIEDDDLGEQPYIYVKIYRNQILITDTGCDSPRHPDLSITSLRRYIEEVPIPSNQNQPLNPNGAKKYIIICSHCHYDHILGLPRFSSASPDVIVSSYDKDFLENLNHNSLCEALGVPTPEYKITKWANHSEYFVSDRGPCRIQFLHVPGHTPDSLAWYDIDEHHLYVGDTFYERRPAVPVPGIEFAPTSGAIIFPNEGGDLVTFMASLNLLLSFTIFRNSELERQYGENIVATPRVKVACGHNTFNADAEEMVREVKNLFERIIAGKVPIYESMIVRGAFNDFYLENEDARYSVKVPRRLMDAARKHFKLIT